MRRLLILLCCGTTSVFGSTILVTNPAALNSSTILSWSQFGASQTQVAQSFDWWTSGGESINGQLTGGNATIVQACSTCAWKPNSDIAANDALLLTGTGSSADDSVSLTVSPTSGIGAYLDAGGTGGALGSQYSATIQAFAGTLSILTATVTSDISGDPLFLGVSSTTSQITKIIYSLTDAYGNPLPGSFALDNLYISNAALSLSPTAVSPEPAAASLVGGALLALLFGLKRRSSAA